MKKRWFSYRVTEWEENLLCDLRQAQDLKDKGKLHSAEMELGHARKRLESLDDLDTLRESEEA